MVMPCCYRVPRGFCAVASLKSLVSLALDVAADALPPLLQLVLPPLWPRPPPDIFSAGLTPPPKEKESRAGKAESAGFLNKFAPKIKLLRRLGVCEASHRRTVTAKSTTMSIKPFVEREKRRSWVGTCMEGFIAILKFDENTESAVQCGAM